MGKTPEEVDAQAKAETAAAWAKAEALANLKPPKNTIYMGVDSAQASGGRTTLLDFVPNLTTVKVGTRVRFVVKAPTEAHNVGFGPVKYMDKLMKTTDLFPFGPPNPPNQVTPFFIYGSDPPGTPYEGSDDARQRLLLDAARRRDRAASAQLVQRDVRKGREVPLHLHAPRP